MSGERVLVVGPGIRVVVREDCPPGMAYLVDPAAITQTDLRTGELLYPFAAVAATNIGDVSSAPVRAPLEEA